MNFAVYETLQNNAALTVKDEADPLLPMKGVKNEVELAHTREAHIRDGVAMVRFQIELENRLAAGEELTELTIDEILHKYRSAQDKFLTESFGTIAAYGPNAAMMHYHATEEDHAKLEKKGFLLVDSGATYMDGTTDITRTVALGCPAKEMTEKFTVVLKAHIALASARLPQGVSGNAADIICRSVMWRRGLDYKHGTGHGVGCFLNVHEGPQNFSLHASSYPLAENMIVSIEPGYYRENALSLIHI